MIELLRGSEVLRICKEKKQTLGAMMLERETELQGKSKQVLLADMQQQLTDAFLFREKYAAGCSDGNGYGRSQCLYGAHRSCADGRCQRHSAGRAACGPANPWL